MKETLKMNPRFVLDALRNLGYTNYSAIADIIDNSIETDVDSKNVYINVNKIKNSNGENEISSISIFDDGCGMSEAILQEAMTLGSNTGKNPIQDLGMYGAGLKTASLSIGKQLEVYTKTENNNIVYKATLNIEPYELGKEKNINVEYESFNENTEEFKNFINSINSQHGTIVIISKLDKLSNKSWYTFSNTLALKIRQIFNKFIEARQISFYINGEKLKDFDPIGNKHKFNYELIEEKTFEYNSNTFSYKFWFSPDASDKRKDNDYWGVNYPGLFIYRQRRLVGEALDLGIMNTKGDNYSQGIKVELFVDGQADSLFGTTFTKEISEKDRNLIEQGFSDTLTNHFAPLISQCRKIRRSKEKSEINADIQKTLGRTEEELNNNRFLKNNYKTFGKNQKQENTENNEKNENPKPQTHPNPNKIRKERWFAGFRYEHNGAFGKMYDSIIENNKPYLIINTDHVFFTEIFSKLSQEGQQLLGIYLAMDIQAKQKSQYWIDEDVQKHIDEYTMQYAEVLRQAFI